MNRQGFRKIRAAVGFFAAALSGTVLAQTVTGYNYDCDPAPISKDTEFQIDICRSHVSCDIAYRAGAAGCNTKTFLDRVTKVFTQKGKIESDDVFDAARPPKSDTITQEMRDREAARAAERNKFRAEEEVRQRSRSNAANEAVSNWTFTGTLLPPQREGGTMTLFDNRSSAGGATADGTGVMIGDQGMARGTFRNGQLEGEGEQILPDGTYRGGSYRGGQLNGRGFQFGAHDAKYGAGSGLYVREGEFKGDVPDGIVTQTYDDGSSLRVRYVAGSSVGQSSLAGPGVAPKDPPALSAVELAQRTWTGDDVIRGERLVNGKRDGMMERIRPDGSCQFEDWDNGVLMQVGVKMPSRDNCIAPQTRPNAGRNPGSVANVGNGPIAPVPLIASIASTRNPVIKINKGAGWTSVCDRNFGKFISATMNASGEVNMRKGFNIYIRIWEPCRSYDPKAVQYVNNYKADNERNENSFCRSSDICTRDTPGTIILVNEFNKIPNNPNYSKEMGKVYYEEVSPP